MKSPKALYFDGDGPRRREEILPGVTYRQMRRVPPEYSHPPIDPIAYQQHRSTHRWTFVIVVAVISLSALILFATVGHGRYDHLYHEGHYHPSGEFPGYPAKQEDPTLRNEGQCALGETWDTALQLCATTPVTPLSVDPTLMDKTANPCTDFEKYMCGAWDADPAHMDETRGFTSIARVNDRQVSDIIRDPSVEGVHAFYRSCVETAVEGKHVELNNGERNRERRLILGELSSTADLPEVFALLSRNGFTAPFALQIENHPTKDQAIPLFRYDGFQRDISYDSVRNLFLAAKDSVADATRKARIVLDVVSKLQANEPPEIADYLDYLKGDQLRQDIIKWGDFKKRAFMGGFAWDRYLQRLDGHGLRFADDQDVWVLGREYFWSTALSLIEARHWRVYVQYSITYHTANYFPRLPGPAYFRVHHPLRVEHTWTRMRRFEGRPRTRRDGPDASPVVQKPTEADCVRATQYLLPGLVSDEFLRRNPEVTASFPRVKRIVENIRDAYADIIANTPGLSNETKMATMNKYRQIVVRVGHPTAWKPEPFADALRPDHFMHNLDRIREYRVARNLALWREGGVQDRDAASRFGSPLSAVNAFYQPTSNTISILPGILKYPFYHPRMNLASMYAGIGMVCGHELGHAGDPHGIEFDEFGDIRQWWTPAEKAALTERYACLIPEYTAPDYCEGYEDYGTHTLGENVADLMGLSSSLRALKKDAPDGGLQQYRDFYSAYAQTWCSSYSREKQCTRVITDVHANQVDRVNVPLRNLPSFRAGWDCPADSPMVHDPACTPFGI